MKIDLVLGVIDVRLFELAERPKDLMHLESEFLAVEEDVALEDELRP